MNILFIGRLFYPSIGGVEKVMLEYATGLISKGHTVSVLTAMHNRMTGEVYPGHEQYRGISISRVFSLGGRGMSIACVRPSLLWSIAKRCDVIHVHDFRFGMLLSMVLKVLLGKKVVFQPYGLFFHTQRYIALKRIIHAVIFRPFFRMVDRTIAISRHDYNLVGDGRALQKTVIIKGGVDYDTFSKIVKNVSSRRLLYFGRIYQNKGLDQLFRALARLKDCDFELRIAGDGSPELIAELRRLSHDEGIDDRIIWLGRVDEQVLMTEFSAAKIMFMPSLYESFGLALLEGMATATVPIVNDIDTFREVIRDGENGYIVDFSDSCTAAVKIREILGLTDAKLQEVGKRAQLTANDYGWAARTCELEALYRGIGI